VPTRPSRREGVHVASISKKANRWYVRWREPGGRKRAQSFKSEDGALAFKAEVEQQARPPEKPLWRGGLSMDELKFAKSHPEYIDWSVQRAQEASRTDGGEMALAEYVRRMIDSDSGLRPTTRALYLRNLRVWIEGTDLGRTDIRMITPRMLSDWWGALDAGVGARRNVQQLVSKAFNRAVVAGDLATNPLKRAPEVKRPGKGRADEVVPLTAAQIEALADAATLDRRGSVPEMSKARDRLEILVMGFAGLRAGEVGGLRRQDMVRSGKRCQLRLRQQVTRVTGQGASVSPLKTRAAMRIVDVACSLFKELESFVKRFPPAEDGRVFHGPRGELRAHNDINHAVVAAGKRIGADVNAHQLRHSAVSLLIDAGANPRAIQAFVGHTDIRMTLQTYGHLFDQGGEALAAIMESLRNGR
jgi:integrase